MNIKLSSEKISIFALISLAVSILFIFILDNIFILIGLISASILFVSALLTYSRDKSFKLLFIIFTSISLITAFILQFFIMFSLAFGGLSPFLTIILNVFQKTRLFLAIPISNILGQGISWLMVSVVLPALLIFIGYLVWKKMRLYKSLVVSLKDFIYILVFSIYVTLMTFFMYPFMLSIWERFI